jgi:dolichyl-phosphate beta-glucosyltransferase
VCDVTYPLLSIIIPAYNEAKRLPQTLMKVNEFILSQPYHSEVLIIENGSEDETLQIAQEFADRNAFFRVIKADGRGKGLAVRRGMSEAIGEYRFMCDADLSMPVSEINLFIPPLLTGFDIAIGSREASGAVRYNEPAYRHIGGRVINTIIRLFALPGLHDTQCGFKCFHARTIENLFSYQTMLGWSFDIELLFIARKRGYKIVEVPIHWYFDPKSKLSVIKDALRMGLDLFQIRQNSRQGLYDLRQKD